jgi:hypothetical protein
MMTTTTAPAVTKNPATIKATNHRLGTTTPLRLIEAGTFSRGDRATPPVNRKPSLEPARGL